MKKKKDNKQEKDDEEEHVMVYNTGVLIRVIITHMLVYNMVYNPRSALTRNEFCILTQ